jgi:hypothetical protein
LFFSFSILFFFSFFCFRFKNCNDSKKYSISKMLKFEKWSD